MSDTHPPANTASDSGYPNDPPKEEQPPLPHPPTTGVVRVLFVVAGMVCLGLAYLGTLLPGLPTTPWLLLASACFARSSPRLHRWLLRSPVFGQLLRDWHEHRGIRRPVKAIAACMVVVACGSSVTFAPVPIWVRAIIAGCGTIGLCVILFVVPTIREK